MPPRPASDSLASLTHSGPAPVCTTGHTPLIRLCTQLPGPVPWQILRTAKAPVRTYVSSSASAVDIDIASTF